VVLLQRGRRAQSDRDKAVVGLGAPWTSKGDAMRAKIEQTV
jgi:hypothetical protein